MGTCRAGTGAAAGSAPSRDGQRAAGLVLGLRGPGRLQQPGKNENRSRNGNCPFLLPLRLCLTRARAPLPAGALNRVPPEGPFQPEPLRCLRPRHSPLTPGSPRSGRAPCTPAAAPAALAPRPGTRAVPGGGTAAVSQCFPLCPGGSRRPRSHLCPGAPGPARPRRRLVPPLRHRPLRHFRPPRPARSANHRPCRRTHPHPPVPGRYHTARRAGGCVGFASTPVWLHPSPRCLRPAFVRFSATASGPGLARSGLRRRRKARVSPPLAAVWSAPRRRGTRRPLATAALPGGA